MKYRIYVKDHCGIALVKSNCPENAALEVMNEYWFVSGQSSHLIHIYSDGPGKSLMMIFENGQWVIDRIIK